MFEVRPLTDQTWADLEDLFDLPGGAIVRGCWCVSLLAGAVDYAREHGVRMLEAYPVDKLERSHDDFMFFGSRSRYEKAGFRKSYAARRHD